MVRINFRIYVEAFLIFCEVLSIIFIFSPLQSSSIIQFFVYSVCVVAVVPMIISSIRGLFEKKFSIDFLSSAALIFSIVDKQFISALFIALMLGAARIFSEYSESHARRNIESLLKLRPVKGKVIQDGHVQEKEIEQIKVGDLLQLDIGDRVPVDGDIVSGSLELDTSALSGESVPSIHGVGSRVLSSSVILSGNAQMKVTHTGTDTTLEKIIVLVENSRKNKSKSIQLAEKFSVLYVLFIAVVSITLFLLGFRSSVILSFLLVVCADDIAVAIPLGFLSAISYAASKGVIIKGGQYLEALGRAKVFLFDKTGTITKGRLHVEDFLLFDGFTREELFRFGSMITTRSSHPASRALHAYIEENKIETLEPTRFEEYGGKGVKVYFEKKVSFIGRLEFLAENSVVVTQKQREIIEEKEKVGFTLTFVAIDSVLAGAFLFADEIKPHIRTTLQELEYIGVESSVMLTGDNHFAAERIAHIAGVKKFHADLLPEQKVEYIKKYISSQYATVMVGDGLNDAAGLSLADVGIVMGGTGYDVSIETADIVLMKDDFSQIPHMMMLSRRVMQIAKENYYIWGIVNVVGIILVFSGVFSPIAAAFYNFATDFIPLINSSRLLGTFISKADLPLVAAKSYNHHSV